MSRAGAIIEWVLAVDEADTPTSMSVDMQNKHDLNMARGYHYQDRYAGDDMEDGEDSKELDGTKPSGMLSNAPGTKSVRTTRKMGMMDRGMMDTR